MIDIYLAAPYSHPYPRIVHQRVTRINRAAGAIIATLTTRLEFGTLELQ